MAPKVLSDAEKVAEFISEFEQYSASLLEESVQEQLRSRLQDAKQQAAEKQASSESEIERAQEQVKEAEVACERASDAEKAAAAEVTAKAELLANVQVDFANAEAEHKEAQSSRAQEAREGEELRKAKAKNMETSQGPFQALLDGSWADDGAKTAAVQSVQEYLEQIRVEKALVAGVPGLGVMPEARGLFDNVTVESVSEVMAEKLRELEEKLTERAPAEKEAKTELLGLWALMDVCKEKLNAATEEHSAAEAALKDARAAMKPLKKEVAKLEKAASNLRAERHMEEEKVMAADEALLALGRLCEERAAQAVEAAAAEAAAAAAKEEKEEQEVAEPAAKRARVVEQLPACSDEEQKDATMEVEDEASAALAAPSKQATLDVMTGVKVASPARAARSRLSLPTLPAAEEVA